MFFQPAQRRPLFPKPFLGAPSETALWVSFVLSGTHVVRLCITGFIETPHRFSRQWQNPAIIVASLTAFQEYCRKTASNLRENGQQLLPKTCKFKKCSLAVTCYKIVKRLLREQISGHITYQSWFVMITYTGINYHFKCWRLLQLQCQWHWWSECFKKINAWHQPVHSTILPAFEAKIHFNHILFYGFQSCNVTTSKKGMSCRFQPASYNSLLEA